MPVSGNDGVGRIRGGAGGEEIAPEPAREEIAEAGVERLPRSGWRDRAALTEALARAGSPRESAGRHAPAVALEYGVMVPDTEPTVGLEYGVFVPDRPEPTVGLEYGVFVPDRPRPAPVPEPTVGLEYGVFVPDTEPTVGLEYGVFVPDRPPPAPVRPEPRPIPEPTVGLEYGVFVPDRPEPTVGLEYGVFVPDRPPAPSVGLEYGVFVPDRPEPSVGLEYGVFVPDREPTVGLEYGVFVPDRPPAGGEGKAIAKQIRDALRSGDARALDDAVTDMGVPHHGPGVDGRSMGKLEGAAAKKKFNDAIAGLGDKTYAFVKEYTPLSPLRLLNMNRMVQAYGTDEVKTDWNRAMKRYIQEASGGNG